VADSNLRPPIKYFGDEVIADTLPEKPHLSDKLKRFAKEFKRELEVYRRVLKHPQTPLTAKVLLGLAVGYVLMPFDLIPDFIPILGQLDDLLIVPGLVWMARKMIAPEIIEQCRDAPEM
jgi:uncharacterized membrane protein YkvA (DUF1232 family)